MSGERVGQRGVGKDGDRIDHHAALEALDLAHLLGLIGGLEIAVDDADPARLRHGDGEPRLGDGVHRRGDDRQVEADRAGELRGDVDVALGMTALKPGRSSTSSNASPSGKPVSTIAIACILRAELAAEARRLARLPNMGGSKFLGARGKQ